MDPFSITAGALGITSFAVSSINQLHNTITGLSEARDIMQDVTASLEAIQRPLSALEGLKISDSTIYAVAKEDIEKAGVPEAVNSCGQTCDKFRKQLEKWTKHSSTTKMSLRDRLSVGLWNKEKIRTLRTQVQSCQSIVQFSVESTQLIVQLRSETVAKAHQGETKDRLYALENAVHNHIELTKREQERSQKQREEYEEEPEDEEDGGAQRTLALEEVEEQSRILKDNYAFSKTLVEQVKAYTMQKITDVKANDDSTAVAGFINTAADPNLEQDISRVNADKGSFAGAGVIMGLDFGSLHRSRQER